jgi:hypothetical protein
MTWARGMARWSVARHADWGPGPHRASDPPVCDSTSAVPGNRAASRIRGMVGGGRVDVSAAPRSDATEDDLKHCKALGVAKD